MANPDIEAARVFHEATKHSPESVRSSHRFLDWDNQPRPYKLYVNAVRVELPGEMPDTEAPALEAITRAESPSGEPRQPNIGALASILHYSAGITKHLQYPGGTMPFRAAACTGALYHVELYLVCRQLPGLEAGVYQYAVEEDALRRLRAGDLRGALVEATAGEPAIGRAPVVVVCTSTFWRNAWKYESRAYRHSFWDTGTILANLLAMASAHGLPARVVAGFVDAQVNQLVDVDGEHEAAIALVALGQDAGPAPEARRVERLGLETVPLSRSEVGYPAIRAAHAASSLTHEDEVAAWRQASLEPRASGPESPGSTGTRETDAGTVAGAIERVIRRRGSARRFSPTPIDREQLATILRVAAADLPADISGGWLEAARAELVEDPLPTLNDIYLIANAVEGLESGAYVYQRDTTALELLRPGSFRAEAGYLALTQRLAADAAANVYFLADLQPILARLGNRGYRAAQLDASIRAGRIYLGAYSLGLGASGLTFFDDEVISFFSPHAAQKSVMFLIAIGHPARPVSAATTEGQASVG